MSSSSTSESRPPSSSSAVLKSLRPLGKPLLEERTLHANTEEAKPCWTFGRCPTAAFCLEDVAVSRRHANLKYSPASNQWTITDLKSTNGVFVNGSRVRPQEEHPLEDGCQISLGPPVNDFRWIWTFQTVAAPAPPKPDPEPEEDSSVPSEVRLGSRQELEELKEEEVRMNVVYLYPDAEGRERRVLPVKYRNKVRWIDIGDEDESQNLDPERGQQEGPSDTAAENAGAAQAGEEDSAARTDEGEPKVKKPRLEGQGADPEAGPSSKEVQLSESNAGAGAVSGESSSGQPDRTSEQTPSGEISERIAGEKQKEADAGEDPNASAESEEKPLTASQKSPSRKISASESPDGKKVLEKLKNKFNEELSCSICNEVFISPMSMPCGHVFCKFCLSKWKKQCQSRQYDCPNCRQKVGRDRVTPNLYLENLITSWTSELGADMLAERKKAVEDREKQEKEDAEEENARKKSRQDNRRRGTGRRGGRRGGGARGTIEAYLSARPGIPVVIRASGESGRGGRARGGSVSAAAAGGSSSLASTSTTEDESGGGRYGLRSSSPRRRGTRAAAATAPVPSVGQEVILFSNNAASSHDSSVVEISSDTEEDDENTVQNEEEDEDDDLDFDGENGDGSGSDSDASVEGLPGAIYGGYGTCYNCGRRGHWAPGCPFD